MEAPPQSLPLPPPPSEPPALSAPPPPPSSSLSSPLPPPPSAPAALSAPSPTPPAPVAAAAAPATARLCTACALSRAVLAPSAGARGERLCRACFLARFEAGVQRVVLGACGFVRGETVAVACSGGKDSTVLAHVLALLNARCGLGLRLVLVAVDEGIAGYREQSLECVRLLARGLRLPLLELSYAELFEGWSMDRVVAAAGGARNACAFCGVLRRQALDRAAARAGARSLAVGHNADDVAETVLMNLLRGDIARLGRCATVVTGGGAGGGGGGGGGGGAPGPAPAGFVRRVRPLIGSFEREIVLYAHHSSPRLAYHAQECTYAPFAYRGFLRALVKDLEAARPRVLLDIVRAAGEWRVDEGEVGQRRRNVGLAGGTSRAHNILDTLVQ